MLAVAFLTLLGLAAVPAHAAVAEGCRNSDEVTAHGLGFANDCLGDIAVGLNADGSLARSIGVRPFNDFAMRTDALRQEIGEFYPEALAGSQHARFQAFAARLSALYRELTAACMAGPVSAAPRVERIGHCRPILFHNLVNTIDVVGVGNLCLDQMGDELAQNDTARRGAPDRHDELVEGVAQLQRELNGPRACAAAERADILSRMTALHNVLDHERVEAANQRLGDRAAELVGGLLGRR